MIPEQYKWLNNVIELPKTIQEGIKLLGTKEIKGSKHNQVILDWATDLGISKIVRDDEQAWCGLAAAIVVKRAGKDIPMKSYDILRALKWVDFGKEILTTDISLGDIAIFKRDGGGHVGFYIAEDSKTYHIMGGNQSDMFNITRITKERLYAARRPIYNITPKGVKKYVVSATGTISKNEK